MRKAFIDQILLGFVLFAGLFILAATVNDDTSVRTKFYNLKKLTDTAALAAAKHYNENQDTTTAENISRAMLDKTNLGLEVIDNIEYIWDFVSTPNNVIARITNYEEDLFWYRLLSLNSFNFENIESKANIISSVVTQTANFAPLAINQCNRTDLIDEAQLTFEFHSYNEFDNIDEKGFYAVTQECSQPHGNSFFAHFKNIFNNPSFDEDNNFQSDIDVDVNNDTLCLPQTDFQNPNTVDPKQLYDKLRHFDVGSKLQIALLDCNSTAAQINVSSLITVEFMAPAECTQGTWTNTPPFIDRIWNEQRNNCTGGNYDYKLLKLNLKISIDDDDVNLEY